LDLGAALTSVRCNTYAAVSAQAAPKCLLWQDIARRSIGTQTNDYGNVTFVATFFEH